MTKRLPLFIVALVALLMVPVSMIALVPASAEAETNSVVWLDTTYKGADPLIGGHVQAYEAGSTATLLVSIRNTTEDSITVKGAKVKFDWAGGEYAATPGNYPTTLASNESGTATISFTVPETSVASNQVGHSYSVFVDYEKEGGYRAGTQIGRTLVGTASGGDTVFYLPDENIDPDTLHVYIDDVITTAYHLDCLPRKVVFNTPLFYGQEVTADYELAEEVGVGDGVNTVFHLDHAQVVSGTERVFVDCTLTSSYALDRDTGTIRFNTAPAAGSRIAANYRYTAKWTSSGNGFAVYSTDQKAAMAVRQQLAAIGTPAVASAGSREQMAKAAMEQQLGDQQYAAGNLDEAKGHYDQAFMYTDEALKGDKDPNTFGAVEPMGTLLLGIGMVLLAFGVIVYAVKKPRGPTGA